MAGPNVPNSKLKEIAGIFLSSPVVIIPKKASTNDIFVKFDN
jgi:hypothetical protein